jgi:hypothetical protein
MSSGDGSSSTGGGSRQSNLNKSVNAQAPAKPEAEEDRIIDEKVAEFVSRYPDRAGLPVACDHGRAIRRDYAHVDRKEWVEDQPDIPELELVPAASGVEVDDITAYDWAEAIHELLHSYRLTEETTLHLERGTPRDPEYAAHDVAAENRWFAEYQKRYFAQLDGWLRELTGGERPSGGESTPAFDDPHIALITRSASSIPDGERVGPVDHAAEMSDAWEPTYHALRNTLRSNGYSLGEDWQYDRRLEPHTGKRGELGINECYAHEHIIVVVDGAVSEADFRPVIDKHVDECDWATDDAHGDGAIEVKEASELADVAAYVADYCSIDPVPLTERDPEYVAWAAAMTAGNIRTVSRSEAAAAAAAADACKQRAESPKADQDLDHGDELVRSGRAGYDLECRCCGSPHGIDQNQTLAAARLDDNQPAAADGGTEVVDDEARENNLRERWQDAKAAAQVGESPSRLRLRKRVESYIENNPDASKYEIVANLATSDAPPPLVEELVAEIQSNVDRDDAVSFERFPEWRLTGVTIAGEEHGASSGNGIEMVSVQDPKTEIADALPEERLRCECGVAAHGTSMASHILTHGIEDTDQAVSHVSPIHR